MSDTIKVAVVTGSALNIGRAIALHLARILFRILVTARQSQHDAEETVRLVRDAGSDAHLHMTDISDPTQARGLIEAAVAHFGRLDALVNNASVRRQTPFADMTPEEWREIMGSTLDGAFYCAHAAAPHIAASGGGSIVNLGSCRCGRTGARGDGQGGDSRPDPGAGEGTGKGRHHDEHGRAGFNRDGPRRCRRRRPRPSRTARCLMGRRGHPAEIAAMVRFLCSDEARYVTGQTIHVNGGTFMP